jgi:hypothetical protein
MTVQTRVRVLPFSMQRVCQRRAKPAINDLALSHGLKFKIDTFAQCVEAIRNKAQRLL